MKAIVLKSFGGPESFELCDVPKPVPQAGQVLVRVHATSINPLDYQVRRGDYPDLVPLPTITGHDVSGVIEAVGAGVTAYAPGDEVWYTPQIFEGQGSYAEYHVAAESIVGRKPAALSHLEAASLSLVGGTAWEALVARAGCGWGEHPDPRRRRRGRPRGDPACQGHRRPGAHDRARSELRLRARDGRGRADRL